MFQKTPLREVAQLVLSNESGFEQELLGDHVGRLVHQVPRLQSTADEDVAVK